MANLMFNQLVQFCCKLSQICIAVPIVERARDIDSIGTLMSDG